MEPAPTATAPPRLPWWALVPAGALYGLAMRVVFGLSLFGAARASSASGAMLWSFVVLVPLLIGVLTVWVSRDGERSILRAIISPWPPILLFVGGTALLLLEGSICIAMALPLFLLAGSAGGLAMALVLRFYRPSPAVTVALLALPLFAAAWERSQPLPDQVLVSEASVVVRARPEQLWSLINDARGIRPDEMRGLAWRIGVPVPQSALTVPTVEGRVRKLHWDRGVKFDEPIVDWQPGRYVRWTYDFAPGAIPPEALDEHVVIGGRYFDLVDTSYRLTPVATGTRMDIRVHYRVSTPFNWYARAWAHALVDDASRTILGFYRQRAEARNAG